MSRTSMAALPALLIFSVLISACSRPAEQPAPKETAPAGKAAPAYELPRGLEGADLLIPEDNPLTAEKIGLGEQLFFDTRLSKNKKMSCETCHVPEKGWTDGKKLSPKWNGSMNTRHSPTLYGVGFFPELYWDGRAVGLEKQILAAWKGNMGGEPEAMAAELNAIDGYRSQFEAAFGGPATGDSIVKALASFVRTIHAGDTPWDRHPQDEASLAGSDIGKGFTIFSEVANCTLCHAPPLFSDGDFHNVGIGFDTDKPDMGRGSVLAKRAADAGEASEGVGDTLMGAFKTPTLRGAAISGPYFHDGRAATLEEAVDLMLAGGISNDRLDARLQPVSLTAEQRGQLLAFLRALTPEDVAYDRPALP